MRWGKVMDGGDQDFNFEKSIRNLSDHVDTFG